MPGAIATESRYMPTEIQLGRWTSDDRAIPRRRPGNQITQLLRTLIRSKETVPKRHGLEEMSVQGATSGEIGPAESCMLECRPATGDSAGETVSRPTRVTNDSGHRGKAAPRPTRVTDDSGHRGKRRLGPTGSHITRSTWGRRSGPTGNC